MAEILENSSQSVWASLRESSPYTVLSSHRKLKWATTIGSSMKVPLKEGSPTHFIGIDKIIRVAKHHSNFTIQHYIKNFLK